MITDSNQVCFVKMIGRRGVSLHSTPSLFRRIDAHLSDFSNVSS